MHKYAKPLVGYLEEEDYDRLDRVKNLVFSNKRRPGGRIGEDRETKIRN
jgi:hypothetical protein